MGGLKGCPTARLWSEEEVRLLREHYPDHGAKWAGWAEVLPGRTEGAIGNAAVRRGLTRRTPRWTPAQDESLGRILAELARRTGRAPTAVATHMLCLARRMGEGEGR